MKMKARTRAAWAASAAVMALASLVAPVSAGAATATRWVDDDGRAGPSGCGGRRAAATSIQSAIDKSDWNDVVIVCPGRYTGTIRITGARDGITVRGSSGGSAVLRVPKSHVADAAVWIEGVSDVTLQWITVAFPSAGCKPHINDVIGLFARDAGGLRVVANQIRTAGTMTQSPCGYVDGIRVLSSRRVLVRNNVVRDFQSDGISFEEGTRGLIKGNAVHFYHGKAGSDDDGDQGIRVVTGARAEIAHNVVRSYPGLDKPHTELGISIQQGGGVSDVHHNRVWYAKVGIGVIDSSARISSNDLFGVGLQRGVHIVSGSGTKVLWNRIQRYQTGIQVDASATAIRGNDARDNVSQGCLDTTTGSGTAGTANTWSGNVGTPAASPKGICAVP